VPVVAPIWVMQDDSRAESQGATLFAAIAHGSMERPDVLVSEAPGAQRATTSRAANADQDGAFANKELPARGSWSRRERVLMVLVIVMTILMFLIINANMGG
jgi:hypothetical protein